MSVCASRARLVRNTRHIRRIAGAARFRWVSASRKKWSWRATAADCLRSVRDVSGSLDVLYPILLALALGILLMRVGIYCLMVSDKLVIIFFGIPIMLRYESITSIQVRGLLGLFRAEY